MLYSLSTLKRKANAAGYSFQKGYQRYVCDGWGYVTGVDGERIIGYQIFDYRTGFLVHPSCNNLWDHAMDLEKATELLRDLCTERGVRF